jgi:hypothetical protein
MILLLLHYEKPSGVKKNHSFTKKNELPEINTSRGPVVKKRIKKEIQPQVTEGCLLDLTKFTPLKNLDH